MQASSRRGTRALGCGVTARRSAWGGRGRRGGGIATFALGTAFPIAALAGIVGNVPPVSFEMECRKGYQLLHFPGTRRALLDGRIGKFLHPFELVLAVEATILIDRHTTLPFSPAK